MSLITDEAEGKIARFNAAGLDYNIVAAKVYDERRKTTNPFGRPFLSYIIAGLIAFDLLRQMGNRNKAYAFDGRGFGARLEAKLSRLRGALAPLMSLDIAHASLDQHRQGIKAAYGNLAADGEGSLHDHGDHFHVGAAKTLHFMNPDFFIIVDSNAARAFRAAHGIGYRNTTQPGYSAERYVECMYRAQEDITRCGVGRFQSLEPGTPLCRVYDKLTFVTGSK